MVSEEEEGEMLFSRRSFHAAGSVLRHARRRTARSVTGSAGRRASQEPIRAWRKTAPVLILALFILSLTRIQEVQAQVKFDGIDDDSCLDFSWTEPSNADSVVAHYHIYLAVDGGDFQQIDTTLTTSYSVAGDSGRTYRLKVAGVNHSGEEGVHSPESDEILCLAASPDQAPPKSTSQLSVQESEGQLQLTWPAVTEDTSGGAEQISHYIVYRSSQPLFTTQNGDSIAGVSELSYTDPASGIGSPELNHFYGITAVDMAGNESQISNRVGEFDYGIIPQNAGYYLVSPILDDGQMTTAGDLGAAITGCTAVKEWDPEAQSYRSRAFRIDHTWYGDTPLSLGYPYYVFIEAGPESCWTILGSVPEDPVFTLHAPGGNGYNTITLPLSSTLSLASELGASIPHCTAVKRWDPSTQAFESIAFKVGETWYGDTPLQPGMPYYVNVTADGQWPGGKHLFSYDDRLRQTDRK
jgi:hypothetical protein